MAVTFKHNRVKRKISAIGYYMHKAIKNKQKPINQKELEVKPVLNDDR